jgi:hypothetical protein
MAANDGVYFAQRGAAQKLAQRGAAQKLAQQERCVLVGLTHYPIHRLSDSSLRPSRHAGIHATGSGFSLHAEPALRCAAPNRSLCGARDATSRGSAEKEKQSACATNFRQTAWSVRGSPICGAAQAVVGPATRRAHCKPSWV